MCWVVLNIEVICWAHFRGLTPAMTFNPNFEEIGNAFVQHYYTKFDVPDVTLRSSGLSDLYDPQNSYMTFEGVQVKGRDAILQKFAVTFSFLNLLMHNYHCVSVYVYVCVCIFAYTCPAYTGHPFHLHPLPLFSPTRADTCLVQI